MAKPYDRPPVLWEKQIVATGGRIDSMTNCGRGILLCGGRVANAGKMWRSRDYGETWTLHATFNTTTPHVLTLANDGAGRVYATTSNGDLWRSTDWGKNWAHVAQISSTTDYESGIHRTYGLCVVQATGTVLIADTTDTGGHIFRSTDGGDNFTDLGAFGSRGIYRFQEVGDGIVCETWGGKIYKSTNDGANWSLAASVSSAPLYAIEYLGSSIVLLGDEDGVLYRSTDNAATWSTIGTLDGGADDFVNLGGGVVIYCTYTSKKRVYYSDNYGLAWRSLDQVPSGVAEDNLDHVIPVTLPDGTVIGVGGTVEGAVMRITPNRLAA